MRSFIVLFVLAACATEAPAPTTTIEQHAGPCDGDECPEDPLPACDLCDETGTCTAECRDERGHRTTCAEAGYCQSCDACGPDVACGAQCVEDGGRVTTCETQKTQCQRYDLYCGFPVIGGATVTDIHEDDAPKPAYLYFESYGDSKIGNIPQSIDGSSFSSAWASNFRGIRAVTGESARTQFEWPSAGSIGTWYPYTMGRRCAAAPAGTLPHPFPVVQDRIYEDDEFINGDDFVGTFSMAPAYCFTDVYAKGNTSGWSDWHTATTGGDVSSILYRLWCSSCLGASTPNAYACNAGVVW